MSDLARALSLPSSTSSFEALHHWLHVDRGLEGRSAYVFKVRELTADSWPKRARVWSARDSFRNAAIRVRVRVRVRVGVAVAVAGSPAHATRHVHRVRLRLHGLHGLSGCTLPFERWRGGQHLLVEWIRFVRRAAVSASAFPPTPPTRSRAYGSSSAGPGNLGDARPGSTPCACGPPSKSPPSLGRARRLKTRSWCTSPT